MSYSDIILRVISIIVLSSIIGFEREKNRSNAGIKTHALVGLAATLITIIQVRITQDSIDYAHLYPEMMGMMRSDPARLTAQIVSGVGFLGAGTIIVTNRNITGLTTAASIWAVAGLGISVGMGYLDIALIGFIGIISVLLIVGKFVRVHTSEKLIIRYLLRPESGTLIKNTFEKHHINSKVLKYDVAPIGDELICTTHYLLTSFDEDYFDRLVESLSDQKEIVSIETTNI